MRPVINPMPRKDIEMKMKHSGLLSAAYFALFQPLLAIAQQTQQPTGPQPYWNCPGPWHMWGGGWGFWWIFPMIMLLFLIVLAVFFLGRRPGGPHHWGPPWHAMEQPWGRPGGDPTYSALQILNERLAKGEIEKKEYEEKRAIILSGGRH